MTILGGTITDTVYGGSRGVDGSSSDGNVTNTRVLVVGGEIFDSTNEKYEFNQNYQTIVGGSRFSGDIGSTDVTISHLGKTYAVQGGGRHGANTYVDIANVTISGKAEVYYLVCGSVTDGNSSNPDAAVGSSTVTIRHAADIGSDSSTEGGVFAGGWDTYYNCVYPSTEKTKLVIEGGTIWGSAYGGGFRGTVGVGDTSDNTVTIEISGGTVKGSVYGGGKGGPDPVEIAMDNSKNNSTGLAYIDGNVRISMTGGVVEKSLYGGGEGVEKQSGRGGYDDVAKVDGEIDIEISGGTVKGSIYGGGQGKGSNPSIANVSGNISMSISGTVGSVYGGGEYSRISGTTLNITLVNAFINDSVYGGGQGDASHPGTGPVTLEGDLSVTIQNTTVKGSVYGGGMLGDTTAASSHMTISGSGTKVSESVYGGGMGQEGKSLGVMTVSGQSKMEVSSGAQVEGSVYGGGAYGLFQAETVSMDLVGTSTVIGGSVYGGGLGTEETLATIVGQRDIIINGPTINGNVYGGSRFGDDNYDDNYDDKYDACRTSIYILSGNIATGSSGNVYGGAYKGRSKMDSYIYVGSAASGVGVPVEKKFLIHSIYGGASVGEVTEDFSTADVLLHGSTEIHIGGEGYGDSSITGDVFGAGDYCEIEGTATISFEHFRQAGSMLSIQKADEVSLVDTELVLDGSVDGNQISGSSKFSINDVGSLTLGDGTENGRAGLVLNAQVSTLSEYVSDSPDSIISGDSYVTEKMNYIRINGGKMFTVLGPANDGTGVKGISGATYFLRDEVNSYYGALAMSAPVIDASTEFVLEDGTKASRTEYQYSSGVTVTVWYVAGAFTVDETMTVVSGTGSVSKEIGIPKMSSDSTIAYVGHYASMNSEGSLQIVDGIEAASNGTQFNVTLGDGGSGLQYAGGLNLATAESGTEFTGKGASLKVTVATDQTFDKTGYAGTIHIHMIESIGGVTIGTFDMEIAVYLSIPQPEGNYTINQDILVKETGDNQHAGETEVYLPVLDGSAVGRYTLVSVKGIPTQDGNLGTLNMTLAPTQMNKSGWLSEAWKGEDLVNDDYDKLLGEGGYYSPVLHFDFECPGHDEGDDESDWGTITVVVEVVWSDKDGSPLSQKYTINLTPKHASQITLSFYDRWVDIEDETVSWLYPVEVIQDGSKHASFSDDDAGRIPSFTISLQFGDSLMGLSVAIDESLLEKEYSDWWSYVYDFKNCLYTDSNGYVVTGYDEDDRAFRNLPEGYEIIPLYLEESTMDDPRDLLDTYQALKKSITGFVMEDYIENVRWFDNPEGPAQFNFYSQVTDNGLSLYAGYGVILSFEAIFEDDSIDWARPYASPDSVFRTNLSEEVYLNKMVLRVTEGFEIVGFRYENGNELGEDAVENGMLILNDTKIYVVLRALEYDLDITVTDDNGTLYQGGNAVNDSGISVSVTPADNLHFGSKVTVTVSYSGQQYRILNAIGTYGGDNQFTLSDFTYGQASDNTDSTCSFSMPSGNLSLTIELSEGYTLTVTLPESNPKEDDNDHFYISGDDGGDTLTVSEGTGEKEVKLDIGLNAEKTLTLDLPSDFDGRAISFDFENQNGATLSIHDGELRISGITGDVSADLIIHIEWNVEIEGDGYTVQMDGSDLAIGTDTVHTGDRLAIVAEPGYLFDTGLSIDGADTLSGGSDTVIYIRVNGSGDVVIEGSASQHQYVLTLNIVFGGDTITEVPSGTLTIDGVTVSEGLELAGNMVTVEILVDVGTHEVSISYEGYIDNSMDVTVTEATTATIHAVPRLSDETGPQVDPEHYVLWYRQGSADGTHNVTGLGDVSGTFSTDVMTVTIEGSEITLNGFSTVVGTVVFDIGGGSTLRITVIPDAVSTGGNQTV